MTYTNDEIAEARGALVGAADNLRRALAVINCYGDRLNGLKLTHQRDGSAWGEVYDGLKLLVEVLYAERTAEIVDVMMEEAELTLVEAADIVAEKNAPMVGHSTDEVRDELVKFRAWKRSIQDGVLPPENIIGHLTDQGGNVTEPHNDDAIYWLDAQIELCLAALAFRNEPEVAA